MTVAIVRDPIYRGRRFQPEIIELCVRWYLTYRLSYRDLVEMLAERGVTVSHTTIYRWVQQYVPEFERRWSRYAKPVHPSWRVDETAISVRAANAISTGQSTSLAKPLIRGSQRIGCASLLLQGAKDTPSSPTSKAKS
jgi:hypothetical protein